MAYEAKDGDISVFKNNKKTEDKHPDYTGKAQIDGETFYVSFWIKKRDGGDAFFSGQIQRKQSQSASGPVDDPLNPTPAPTSGLGPLDEPGTPAPTRTAKQIAMEKQQAKDKQLSDNDDSGLPF